MKRKLLPLLVALLALGAFQAPPPSETVERHTVVNAAYAAGEETNVSVIADGQTLALDAAPRLVNGTLMVPLRNIAEALGADVSWDEAASSVTAVKGDVKVTLFLNDTNALRNGSAFPLAAPPVMDGNVTMVPLRFFSEAFGSVVKWDGLNGKVTIDREENLLPAVGSYDKLKELMKTAQQTEAYDLGLMKTDATIQAGAAPQAAAEQRAAAVPAAKEAKAVNPDYSATNVQVQGVDEADVVKTDGEYIYQVNKQRIVIARAYPADEMQIVGTVQLQDRALIPAEIYVDGGSLVVIGHAAQPGYKAPDESNSGAAAKKMILPIRQGNLKAVVYDISSKSDIKAVKEVELEGSYVTSRKIGSQVYVVANKSADVFSILNGQSERPAPAYRDSAAGNDFITIPYEKIRYFPDSVYSSYLLIAGFDVKKPEQEANVSAYLGSGENVYASTSNLYVTVTQRKPTEIQPLLKEPQQDFRILPAPGNEQNSVIYKFLMDQGKVRFVASGEVPGRVLNQFSMDEANGYFRIATTKGEVWRTDEQTSKNNLYVLDESMNMTGKIEDIAPGEKIYSVRFMGNRAYMVTFRKVDPLFVLDLSDPQKPAILGKLKIPGYSDYLHPYDETHLIGFGKDAVETANEWSGDTGADKTIAYYQGLKLAMFDVSDVNNPKELFKETIGDRGTDSPLLQNHKALLFSKEKNLLAFPVTVAEIRDDTPNKGQAWAYGSFSFQGVYVYHLDLTNGFQLKGKITHLTDEDFKSAGSVWFESSRNIDRTLYIGSTLYTLSQSEIRASELSSLKEIKRLPIPQ